MPIIAPKIKNKFVVSFHDDQGNKLAFNTALSEHVLRVSNVMQSKYGVSASDLELGFEDDVQNETCEALQQLYNLDTFMIGVHHLDGYENIVRTFTFYDCCVESILHSDVDYAQGSKLEKVVRVEYGKLEFN
jgi:hypothetical protein